jgi:hypothetical protein
MVKSQWKLCQLQLKTSGSSTCVRYFPSVRSFELTSVRHGVYRRLGYCDALSSKIVHQRWNFTWQNSQWFSCRTFHHKRWSKARKAEDINRWTKCETCGDFLAENRRAMCEELLQTTGISSTSLLRILINNLQKRKICARWVPHCLTAERKQKRLETATLLKQI